MKKIVTIFVAIALLTTGTCIYAETLEDEKGQFTVVFIPALSNNTAMQWIMTESNRALFAVLLTFDFMNNYQDNLDKAPYDMRTILFGDMYIGRASNVMVLAYKNSSSKDCIIMLYDTLENTVCNYTVYHKSDSLAATSFIKAALSKVCPGGYYKIEPIDLQRALNKIN